MEINNDSLKEFRADFSEAMKKLDEKYDITIYLGRITYYRNHFQGTLTVDNGSDPEKIAENRFDEEVRDYPETGLRPGMYRQVFVGGNGRKYAALGFRRNAKKYPISIIDIRTGERRKATPNFVKEILNEKYMDNLAAMPEDEDDD